MLRGGAVAMQWTELNCKEHVRAREWLASGGAAVAAAGAGWATFKGNVAARAMI